MSYILEALKKSEQERARGREQDLQRFPVATPPPAPALRPGVVLGLSALLLAGGIAIGWWRPWDRAAAPGRPAAPAPETAPPAGPPRADPAPRVADRPAGGSEVAAPAPSRAEALKELRPLLPEGGSTAAPPPVPAASPPQAAPASPPPGAPAKAAPRPAAEAAAPAARPAAESAPGAEDRKPPARPGPAKELPPPPDRVLALAELPPALREALPPLAIRGFVHSEDARSRMVVINDRMLQEGDEVAAELRLERIDPDGIVLNYKGYRFLAPK